jgi:hypothetical protein
VLGEQKEFSEPFMRVNTQMIDLPEGQWCEAQAWDELAAYYRPGDVSPETP